MVVLGCAHRIVEDHPPSPWQLWSNYNFGGIFFAYNPLMRKNNGVPPKPRPIKSATLDRGRTHKLKCFFVCVFLQVLGASGSNGSNNKKWFLTKSCGPALDPVLWCALPKSTTIFFWCCPLDFQSNLLKKKVRYMRKELLWHRIRMTI